MSENYMDAIEMRINNMLVEVKNGARTVDDTVAILKEELRASFMRGLAAGRSPRKTHPEGTRKNVARKR